MNAETGFSQEGFDAVSRALERLYSGQEGIFYRTVIPYALGGKDPLDGIEVWKSEHGVPHWHYVTYGFTELYEKESDISQESGYGFELTFRLKRGAEEQPPAWPVNLLQNLALYVTGGLNKNYPAIPLISEQVTIGPATTKVVTLVTPVLTIVLVAVLMQLINHTKIGMAMRAVAKDFETSQLMGIKINSVISVTFIIGSFLAAVGSLLYFTNYPGVVPTSGAMPGLKAFVAAVFGGIGSIPGAVVGAFLIGICENIIKGLDDMLVQLGVLQTGLGLTTFSDAFTFALLIVILIAKPTGLFGEKATDKV